MPKQNNGIGLKLCVALILILVSLSSIHISPIYTDGQKPPQLRPFPFDHSQNELTFQILI